MEFLLEVYTERDRMIGESPGNSSTQYIEKMKLTVPAFKKRTMHELKQNRTMTTTKDSDGLRK